MWERANDVNYDLIPPEVSNEKYALQALVYGMSLLLQSEPDLPSCSELTRAQQAFLSVQARQDTTLKTIELLGYVIWALDAIGMEEPVTEETTMALRYSMYLIRLLSDKDYLTIKQMLERGN